MAVIFINHTAGMNYFKIINIITFKELLS